MIKEGKFGVYESVCLVTIVITSKVFFTSPSMVVRLVGTAGWYMTLISAAVAAVGFTITYLVVKRYPGKNIVQIFRIVFGPYIGSILSLLIGALFLFNAAITMREFTEVLKVYVMLLSPPGYIMGIFVIAVVLVCFMGLEPLARFSKLAAYSLAAGLLSVLILSQQNFEAYRLFPILGYGLGRTVYHGVVRSSVYGEAVILAVIAGSLQGAKNIKKAGYISIAISGLLISISVLAFTLAFPYYTAEEITSPMYQMTAIIGYGRFFQRLDPIFLFVWIISSFIAVTAMFYIFLSIYCKVFEMDDMNPIIVPSAVTLFTISIIPKDMSIIIEGYVQKIREFSWTVFYIPSLAALIVSALKKKGGK